MHSRSSDSITSNTLLKHKGGCSTETALPVELRDAVDSALKECFDKSYCTDELLGELLTEVRGPLDSLSKRHGILLEEAIAHAFAASGSRYEVSMQVAVRVSKEALALIESNKIEKLEELHFPLDGVAGKRVIIDVLVFDHATGDLHVISVKRGGGAQGGQAARNARKDLTAAGLMLKNMFLRKGLPVQSVKKVLVDWYGRSGIIARKTVTRDTIDEHFGLAIAPTVETMSAYMKSAIAEKMKPRLMAAVGKSEHMVTRGASAASTLSVVSNDRANQIERKEKKQSIPPTLAECLTSLPLRRQGRQMRSIRA